MISINGLLLQHLGDDVITNLINDEVEQNKINQRQNDNMVDSNNIPTDDGNRQRDDSGHSLLRVLVEAEDDEEAKVAQGEVLDDGPAEEVKDRNNADDGLSGTAQE